MDKKLVNDFLTVIGWKATDLTQIGAKPKTNEQDPPEGDEVVSDPVTTEPKAIVQNDDEPAPVELPEEILALGSLVKDLGGVGMLKALLANAATMQANQLTAEEAEHEQLSSVLISHNKELAEEDVKAIPLPVLRKMTAQYVMPGVDFSLLGSGVKKNKEDKLERPSFFLANRTEKEE